ENALVKAHNPLGKVPCLIMDDQGCLFDSRVIVEYLDTLSPVGRLIPQHGRERAATKCWEAIADGIQDAAIAIRTEQTQRPPELRSDAWVARQNEKIIAALASMDATLGEQSFCMGINFSLADIASGCALAYLDLRFPDINWRDEHTNLARLYDKLMSRPSFQNTQPPQS
ncbi:MAG TPA: glutathione S-transferase C-terminal domain-containing protein, partial [Burkholderiaceae bacterium]|nr:glutathione S-transferase C-terminal domain-containing protein [Burkholderiaceae bacterium]